MKKIMMALGCVACAAGVQAASISWGGDIADETCTYAISADSTAYLIRSATEADATFSKIIISAEGPWTTDKGGQVVGTYTISGAEAEGWNFQATYGIKGADDVGYYSVVIVDGAVGADGKTGSFNYAGYNPYSSPTSGDLADLTISDGWSTWLGQSGFEAVSFTAAPEPTSGLLLLLGVAGLALRRRRA